MPACSTTRGQFPKKTFKMIFTAEEGGSEHCQGDNRFLGATYVADWLAEI